MSKRVTWRRLPRVMVRILALASVGQATIREEIVKAATGNGALWAETVREVDSDEPLVTMLCALLEMPRGERARFAAAFERILENLARDDFFGTERQCDPRGDGRD